MSRQPVDARDHARRTPPARTHEGRLHMHRKRRARSALSRAVLAMAMMLAAGLASATPAHATVGKFANPIGHTADPSVFFRAGSYHAVFPLGSAIGVSTSPMLENV